MKSIHEIVAPLRACALLCLACGLLPAQNFVYTNDSVSPNAVTGWSVDAQGKLTQIPGAPFGTGGRADGVALSFPDQNFTANRIVTSKAANLLFASNDSDGTISAFSLNPATGVLSLVAGSPFGSLGTCNAGYSLAVTTDGKTLVAGSGCTATLKVYSIGANGSLAAKGIQALNGCGASGGTTGSLKFTWDGQYIAVADRACSTIEMFQLDSTGALQVVRGSPFKQGAAAAQAYSVDIGCANGSLYTAGSQGSRSTVDAFSLAAGVLTELAGAPYNSSNVDLQSAALTPDDRFLVVSGWNSTKFSVFSTGPGGTLTQVPGSPFGFGDLSPAQVAVSGDGKFVYFAEDTGDPGFTPGVGVLALSSTGVLTQVAGSPFRNPRASLIGGNDAVAAFPPKSCQATGPVLTTSASSLTFGSPVGTISAAQTLTLSNTGSANLTISNITVADPAFRPDLTNCFQRTLQPGQTCTVPVTFQPTAAATKTSSLVIANSGTPNPLAIALTGTGTASVSPAISFNPATLSLKDTVIGTASGLQSVQVMNTGGGPLIITGITPLNSTDFTFDPSFCIKASPIAPGAVCNITVRFHPASPGPYPLNYTILSNADPNASGASVNGTAIDAKACVDTDGDGLCDDWEQNGVYILGGFNSDVYVFLDLPSMGADPRHKDLFIQADWMETDPSSSPYHTHKPRVNAMKIATDAYAKGPVSNPDGTTGVTLHVDCGSECIMNPKTGEKWGDKSFASVLPEIQPFADIDGSNNTIPYDWSNFDKYSAAFKITGRRVAFHHVWYVHDQANNTTSSGVSRGARTLPDFLKGGSDLVVSLGSWDAASLHTDLAEAGTLMHETGHNLALQHGGGQNNGYEPNYLSIMNYNFQTLGLIFNGRQSLLDYSRFSLPDLDEFHLNEQVGLNGGAPIANYGTAYYCPGQTGDGSRSIGRMVTNANGPINWDCDKDNKIVKQTAADINAQYDNTGKAVGTILRAWNDWDHLNFKGGGIGGQGVSVTPPVTGSSADEFDVDKAINKIPLTRVVITAPSGIALVPGGYVTLTLLVSNTGQLPDSYTVTAPAIDGWFSTGTLPATLNLQPGASAPVRVTLSAPATSKAGDRRTAAIFVNSTTGDLSESGQIVIAVAQKTDLLAVSAGNIDFGSRDTGTQSAPAPIVIGNTGPAAIGISAIGTTGDFSQNNDCGTSLAAGASCTVFVSFGSAKAGTQRGVLTIGDNSAAGPHTLSLKGRANTPPPIPQVKANVNAATQTAGSEAPGALFTLYGVNLAAGQNVAASLPLPADIGGTTLTIGGFPAAFTYGDANQINAQIPFELKPGSADFTLQTFDGHQDTGTIQIAPVAPGVFIIPGTQHAAARNQDASVNLANNPAAPGSVITLYYTGEGAVDQPIATGAASPSGPLAYTLATTTATFGGQTAKILFSGMTPTLAGLAQANIAVPATLPDGTPLPAGDYAVVLTVGGVAAPAVNITVGPAH
jgi:uncharacterized protein (TIGR03437 family)